MGVLPVAGYWGEPTATLDWCETNYEFSYYIAEFWNTLSNFFMIVPPLWSLMMGYREGIEKRYLLCYAFLAAVGVGSWCFHMTLLYEMQLMDELPMVWGTLVMVYVLMPVVFPKTDNSKILAAILILYGTTLTSVYIILKHPLIHQVGYAFLMAVGLYLDIRIIRRVRGADASLFYLACLLYYTGFFVWNIDNLFCTNLTGMRQQLPVALHPFTQLHALWHCLAGYGSYVHIYFCIQSRAASLKKPLTWKWSGLSLQLVPDTKLTA